MVKLASLTKENLKEILAEYELPTYGNKPELIQRLNDEIQTDEIDNDMLRHILDKSKNEEIKRKIEGLTNTLELIMERMNKLEDNSRQSPDELQSGEQEDDNNENSSETPDEPEVHDNVSTHELDPRETNELRSETPHASKLHSSIRDIMEALPEFDPIKGNLSSEKFINKINSLAEAYGWHEQAVLYAAQSRLKGHAKVWLDSQPVFQTFKIFSAALLSDFPYVVSSADVHIEMIQRHQTRNETVIEFYYEMLAMGRHGHLDDRSINKHIINGLYDENLKQMLKTRIFQTCSELYTVLRENIQRGQMNQNTITQRRDKEFTSREPKYSMSKFRESNTVGKQNTQKTLVCYNCGKLGHMSINCAEPQKKLRCQTCNRTTHVTANCPNARTNVHEIHDTCETQRVKSIVVNGRRVKGFIDPGCGRTLVRRSFACDLAHTSPCQVALKGFAGGKFECVEQIDVSLEVDGMRSEARMLLVNDELLPEDVLLGRDILCQDGHRLTIESDECRIENVFNMNNVDHLEENEREKLNHLLKQNQHVFSHNMTQLGKCSKLKMEIELTSTTPVQLKPYRIPFARRQIVAEAVSELLKHDIVRPSTSAYASPVVLVMKKNGEPRICVDYRCLNEITKKIPYPMPLIEEQLAQLAGSRYFSTLDLRAGYHQIEIAETSKQYTAFVTNTGHYEYNRMPFGLVNAPGVFQSLMNQMCMNMRPGEVLTYIDDVIIPSKTVEEGLERLGRFFSLLTEYGLTLRMDKCKFLEVETLERFRIYLLGKKFRLVTDCQVIVNTKKQKELKPKIARWWIKLLEYDFTVVHRKGSRLAHVDALSRAPVEPAVTTQEPDFVLNIASYDDWLLTLQLQDETLRKIYAVLSDTLKTNQDNQIKNDYELRDHRIFQKTERGTKFVVPKAIRWRVVEANHDKMGHFALDKTLERIKRSFWFPRMTKYVKEYVASCMNCCYNKMRGGKTEGELHLTEIDPIPFAAIHIDHLGPFVRSKRGNTHIIAISDAFTKYLIVKAVRNTKTMPVIMLLNEMSSFFGLPSKITTDRGTAYTAKAFEEYCHQYHIRHIKTAVRTPRANGQVERANRIILDYLRTTVEQPKEWDLTLHELQWTINSQRNSTTGYTPNQLVFDFNPRDVTKNILTAALQHTDNNDDIPIDQKRSQALERMTTERAKWKERFDRKHAKPKAYEPGDLVVIQSDLASTGESRKLEPRYKGPYVVTKKLENDRCLIENIPGTNITGRNFCSVYATDKIKPWCSLMPDPDGHDSDDSDDSDDTDEPVTNATEADGNVRSGRTVSRHH